MKSSPLTADCDVTMASPEAAAPRPADIAEARTLWSGVVADENDVTMSLRSGTRRKSGRPKARVQPAERKVDRSGTHASATNDFSLVGVLGKGGMGVVYSARQQSLDREIAIKMLQAADAADPDAVDKFLSEAVVTGELDHPNIVPIYDVGRAQDGTVFYAMKEVSGTSWDRVIQTYGLDANLDILLKVGDAVAFAHDRGVIHRDLKPENVMLGDYGEVYVMDWGLAIDITSPESLRDAGAGLAGTPAYMSPEMANCETAAIGRASEIYLLGGILYEIVTGLRPHTGENVYACVAAAMQNIIQPTPIKGELVDIALRAMAARPEDRYATVKDFQEAVRAYRAHAQSLRLSALAEERLARLGQAKDADWYRLAAEIASGCGQALDLWRENRRAAAALRRVRELTVLTALERGDLRLAESQLGALHDETDQFALECPPDGVAIDALDRRVRQALRDARVRERLIRVSVGAAVLAVLAALGIMAAATVVTRAQRDVARQAHDEALQERDRAAAAEAAQMEQHRATLDALQQLERENYYNAIALVDRRLDEGQAAEAENLLYRVPAHLRGWEWGYLLQRSRPALLTLKGHEAGVSSVQFSGDAGRIVSRGHDGRVIVWDAVNGTPLVSLKTGNLGVIAAGFGPEPGQLLLATRDGRLRTWIYEERREVREVPLAGFSRAIEDLQIVCGGEYILGCRGDGSAVLWESATAQPLALSAAGGMARVAAACTAPGGEWLLAEDRDGRLVCVDRASGRFEGAAIAVDRPGLRPAAMAGHPHRIAAGFADGSVVIWDGRSGDILGTHAGHSGAVESIAFAPEADRLASGGRDGCIRVWDAVSSGEFLRAGSGGMGDALAATAPDADVCLLRMPRGVGFIWNTSSWRSMCEVPGLGTEGQVVAIAPLGDAWAYGDRAGRVHLFTQARPETGQPLPWGESEIVGLSFSPDGRRLLAATEQGVRIWRVEDGRVLATMRTPANRVLGAAFAPTGSLLLTYGEDVRVWDGTEGRLVAVLGGEATVTCASFTPDGERVLAGSRHCACLWDVQTGHEIMRLRGHGSGISAVTFSPDGRRIVTCGRRLIKVWDMADGRELLSIAAHREWITAVGFVDRGEALLTAGDDGLVKLWLGLHSADWQRDPQERLARRYRRWLQAQHVFIATRRGSDPVP